MTSAARFAKVSALFAAMSEGKECQIKTSVVPSQRWETLTNEEAEESTIIAAMLRDDFEWRVKPEPREFWVEPGPNGQDCAVVKSGRCQPRNAHAVKGFDDADVMRKRGWILVREVAQALLVVAFFAVFGAVPAKAAQQWTIKHDGVTVFCSTSIPEPFGFDGYTLDFTGTCGTPPPTDCNVPGLTKLTRSAISYGASNPASRSADVTEWVNVYGYASADASEVRKPWPGVSGSGPVVRQWSKRSFMAQHFNTGSSPMYQGSWSFQSNYGGPDLDVVISTHCGDFTPNTAHPGCSRFAVPSDGQPSLRYFSNGANAGNVWCPLSLSTDYYLNVRLHDPTSTTECAGQVCPLFSINYWQAAPVGKAADTSVPVPVKYPLAAKVARP